MKKSLLSSSTVGAVAIGVALSVLPATSANADNQSRIQRGFDINPVPLNLKGKNRALVGLGSYIVNTGGCNDCHTNPSYVVGGNPFMGEPEQINTAGFLAGGQHFGPFVVGQHHA